MTYYNLYKWGKLIAYTYDLNTSQELRKLGWEIQTITVGAKQ